MLAAILHVSQIEFHETNTALGQLGIKDTELVRQGKTGEIVYILAHVINGIQNSSHKSFKQSRKNRIST